MAPASGLLDVGKKHVDSALASLFESSAGPVLKVQKSRKAPLDVEKPKRVGLSKKSARSSEEEHAVPELVVTEPVKESARRKRKRKVDEHDDLEEKFFSSLAKEVKHDSEESGTESTNDSDESSGSDSSSDEDGDGSDSSDVETTESEQENGEEALSEDDAIPIHESLNPSTSIPETASRTVFLGNISITAVTSKSSKRTLVTHLSSILSDIPSSDGIPHEFESIRFRSTPYEATLPNKRAAFAKGAVMDATSPSTNAYAVYSSAAAARAACSKLNGTVVLGRHLRVDSVAHPAPQDPKRCVFVGNLGFTAVESSQPESLEDGKVDKTKKKKKLAPQDPEEGLWTHFSSCGTVESVRVVRDSKTRIGKGFAYVQFNDANAVEKALLLNDQKFPPMLPRKLRVVRARKTKKRDSRESSHRSKGGTEQERSLRGRASKLLGKGGARQLDQTLKTGRNGWKKQKLIGNDTEHAGKMVFEGQRASAMDGNKGLKFGKKKKPSNRSARRAAAWRKGKL